MTVEIRNETNGENNNVGVIKVNGKAKMAFDGNSVVFTDDLFFQEAAESLALDFTTGEFSITDGAIRLPKLVSVPASSTAFGDIGSFAVDSNFLYVAVAQDSWKRVTLEAF